MFPEFAAENVPYTTVVINWGVLFIQFHAFMQFRRIQSKFVDMQEQLSWFSLEIFMIWSPYPKYDYQLDQNIPCLL